MRGVSAALLLALAACVTPDYRLEHQRRLTMREVAQPGFERTIGAIYVAIAPPQTHDGTLVIPTLDDHHPLVLSGRCRLQTDATAALVALVRASAPAARVADARMSDVWLLTRDGGSARIVETGAITPDHAHHTYLLVGAEVRSLDPAGAAAFDHLLSRAGCGTPHP
jgi:hypothetical protein